MMQTIWYSSESDCRHDLKVCEKLDLQDAGDQERIAKMCAEDFHSNHDGWEAYWPRNFTLHRNDNEDEECTIASFEVDREAVPLFRASPVTPKKD